MIFQKSGDAGNSEIRLGEDIFEVVENYKYLGHIINNRLSDITDIKQRLNNFYAKFNSVFRNFSCFH